MARCNLPVEERRAVLHNSERWEHEAEDMERCKEFFDQYLFVETPFWDKKKRIVTCSYCEQVQCITKEDGYSVFNMKHGEGVSCPMCGHSCTVQKIGKLRTGAKLYQTAAVSFINVSPEGEVYMESGIAFDDYYCDYDFDAAKPRMEIRFIGKRRYYFRKGAVMGWKRYIGNYFQREFYGVGGWEECKSITEPFSGNILYGFDGYGYVVGVEKLADSELRYCQIDKYYAEYHKMDIYEALNPLRLVPQYLAEYALHPQIEMAVKLGMSEAVGELVRDGRKNAKYLNWSAKKPAEFVRLGKAEAREFFNNPSLEWLKWAHVAKKSGISVEAAARIAGRIGVPTDRTMNFCDKYGVKIEKIAERYRDGLHAGMWTDYIAAAEMLGYDLTRQDVLLPKYEDLNRKHDEATAAVRVKLDDAKCMEYREKRKKQLEKKYGFAMDGLKIVVPDGIADIVEEGKTLQICVGGYAQRHVDGKTTILFLRHERRPERSFLCIELDNNGRIRQIHGYKNEYIWQERKNLPDPAVKYKAWLDTWLQWVADGSLKDKKGKPIYKERISA